MKGNSILVLGAILILGSAIFAYFLGYERVIPLPVVAVGDEIYVKGTIVAGVGDFPWYIHITEIIQDPNHHATLDPAWPLNAYGGYIQDGVTFLSTVTLYGLFNSTGYIEGHGEISINGAFYFIRLA